MGPGGMHSGMMMRMLFVVMDSDGDGTANCGVSNSSRADVGAMDTNKMAASPESGLCRDLISRRWVSPYRQSRQPCFLRLYQGRDAAARASGPDLLQQVAAGQRFARRRVSSTDAIGTGRV
jgi:hypothetical protein